MIILKSIIILPPYILHCVKVYDKKSGGIFLTIRCINKKRQGKGEFRKFECKR